MRKLKYKFIAPLMIGMSAISANFVNAGVAIPSTCTGGCTLPLPCSEAIDDKPENKHVWESCQSIKAGKQDADAQKDQNAKYSGFSKVGISSKFDEQIKIYVDQLYKEKGSSTYCSLVPNEFVSGREVKTNHVGKSCGIPAELEVQFSYSWTNILGTEYATGLSTKPTVIYHNATPYATLEGSYLKSAKILIASCEKKNMTSWLDQNMISVGSGACQESANNYIKTLKALETYSKDHRYDLDCTSFWDKNVAASASSSDKGELKQSAQKICAIREIAKGMAANLAACETLNRTLSGYLKRIGNEEVQQAIFKDMDSRVSQVCVDECINRYPLTKETAKNPPSPAEITSCANTCYQREVDGAIESTLTKYVGSCS